MEYIFGTTTRDGVSVENLKTVGERHTGLSGFHTTVRRFQDGSEVTDRFRVLEHYQSAESGGKMYDWYIIDSHTRSEKAAPNREAAAAVRLAMMQAQSLPDAQALEVPELYPEWEPDTAYAVQYIVSRQNGHLYRCQQGHTSQEGWEPENTPALWTVIANGEAGTQDDPITAARGMEYQYGLYYRDPEEPTTYPEWVQPTGSHDAYNTGDIVDYNGTLYRSLIDGNVWSPEDYPQGWEVYNG